MKRLHFSLLITMLLALVAAGCGNPTQDDDGGSASGVEHWVGSGVMFHPAAGPVGEYDVEMWRKPVGENAVEVDVKVTLPDGQIMEMEQTVEENGDSFTITSEEGNGGGYDFGEGLLSTYTEGADGSGYAQTIVMDGADQMRILRTELDGGEAQRFFREVYHRQ